mmetsp:Transcript_580/g.2083  ORF Transcript_580/g.2083 Transcript_580/m.2083 type:complete len:225 (+) Transcript_580:3296-3970(+)
MMTCSPVVFNLAKCTCPSDAAANATSSKSSNTSSIGFPNSSVKISLAISVGNGGTRSCNFSNSRINCGLNTSTLVLNCCPTLINVGPNLNNPSLNHFANCSNLAVLFSSVYPPLYVHFNPKLTLRITNVNANVQISNDREIVPTDRNRPKFSGGSDTAQLSSSTEHSSPSYPFALTNSRFFGFVSLPSAEETNAVFVFVSSFFFSSSFSSSRLELKLFSNPSIS